MAGDSTCLGIMKLDSSYGADFVFLDVVEIDIMGSNVYDSEDEQRIGYLAMEPYRFIKRQPSNSGSGESNEVPAHR